MDMKSAFLNGLLLEEVLVAQPKGFEDPHYPYYVLRCKKDLYGFKQVPRAWYERLTTFLLKMSTCEEWITRCSSKGKKLTLLFLKFVWMTLCLVPL